MTRDSMTTIPMRLLLSELQRLLQAQLDIKGLLIGTCTFRLAH